MWVLLNTSLLRNNIRDRLLITHLEAANCNQNANSISFMVRIENNYWTLVKKQIKNEKSPKINEAIVYSYQDDEKVL